MFELGLKAGCWLISPAEKDLNHRLKLLLQTTTLQGLEKSPVC